MTQVASENEEALELRLSDFDYPLGCDLDEAVELNLALGPAAEVVRLAGAKADGVTAGSSTWIVTASAPTA